MNACTVVIFKSIALEASFWSSAFWEYVGAAIFSLTLIGMVPSHRRALLALLGSRDVYVLVPITLSGEAFNLLANLAVGFAGLMAPLALVSIATGLHPVFLLVYGILFTLFFPTFGRERLARRQILQEGRRDRGYVYGNGDNVHRVIWQQDEEPLGQYPEGYVRLGAGWPHPGG